MDTITAVEILEWFKISLEQLHQLRRRSDVTRFPAPCGPGLVWFEADVVDWLAFIADWQEAGGNAEALKGIPTPVYITSGASKDFGR